MGGIFNANTHYIGLARKFKCPWCLKLITEQGSIFQKSVTECDIWDPWFHGRLSGRSCRYDKVDKCALMCYTSLGRRLPIRCTYARSVVDTLFSANSHMPRCDSFEQLFPLVC